MRAIRRVLQVVAFVGTLTVGIMAVALIVSQTPWFRDWARRYIVRESKQYLNGQLSIGGLGGNLLFGVNLADVAVDVSGERIVAVNGLTLDYSVFQLLSTGIVLDQITIDQPVVHAKRDESGWNLAKLVKRERKEADREGPRRPISLPSITIANASISIEDRLGSDGYRLPSKLEGLDVKAGFEYAPVHYSVTLDRMTFTSPELVLQQLSGKLAVRDDNLYIDRLGIRTSESSATIDGVVQQYLGTPVVNLTVTGKLSMPEIGRVLPAAAGYRLHPAVDLKANGAADRLAIDLDVRSEAGTARGRVTADVKAPDFGISGEVDVERLNLAPVLENPAQRSDINGHAAIDLTMASRSAGRPIVERIAGRFAFQGPSVTAAGYTASHVAVRGRLDGPRITLDGRAAAYGGTGTARGFIVTPGPGRTLAFDLRGKADRVDLRRLPPSTAAPKLATDLSVSEYHVRRTGTTTSGEATLNQSTVEGATLGTGTTGRFSVSPDSVTYQARGSTSDLNLQRIGQAFTIPTLSTPRYESRLTGSFEVSGTVPRAPQTSKAPPAPVADTMTLDASGVLRDSSIFGGRLPEMEYEAHVDRGALGARANGRFEEFNPAEVFERETLDGRVTGSVNASFSIASLAAPLTAEALAADGQLTLGQSTVGGLKVEAAEVEGHYAHEVADITRLKVSGPDLSVEANGRLALDEAGASNLEYRVEAVDLAELGKLTGQPDVSGGAILDGTITGNRTSLKATGTLEGSNLSYGTHKALDLDSQYDVTVPNLDVAKAHVHATTDATFLEVAGLQLNSLTATTTYDRKRLEFSGNAKEKARELDAKGTLILHPDHQEIHLPELALRTQGIEWRTAPGSQSAVQYGRARIELKGVTLVSADQSLDLSGSLALKGEAPAGAIDVRARNVDLQQLETLALQNHGLTGRLTADARVAGSTDAPTIDGRFEITKGGFWSYQYDSFAANVDYRGSQIGIDATLQQSPTESITAKGTIPTSLFKGAKGGHVEAAPGDQIDLHVKSSAIGLAMVQGLTNELAKVTGTLEADVHVGGSGEDPHLKGFVDIKNGGFGLPSTGGTFTGLTTRIELEPDRVRIQRFELLDHHGGKLAVGGELATHERTIGAVNVTVESDNFEIIDNELGDVQIQSALKVTGELRRPKIVGDVRLDAARVEVDRVLQLFYSPYSVSELPEVVSAERAAESSGSAEEATKEALAKASRVAAPAGATTDVEAPPPPPLFEALAFDVHVIVPDNLVLRGKGLRPGGPTGAAIGAINITLGGDLHARKDPGARIAPFGTVTTVRGTYEFQGRRFDLVRGGTIRFIGTPTPNPLVDIEAIRKIPNTGVEAKVHISGTAQAPELTLSSQPPLDASDILALIVFNRPVNELGTGERSSLAATAGGIASGFIAAPLGESIARALDVDVFEITTSTDTGEFGAGFTVGKQVGDRAFLKWRQQFGERTLSEFMVEYQLAKFLRLQATGAPETSGAANRLNQRRVERAGIDLFFFFSY